MLEYVVLLFELEAHRLIHVLSGGLSGAFVPVSKGKLVRVKFFVGFHFVVNLETEDVCRRKKEGVQGVKEVLESLHKGLAAMTHMLGSLY